jgi:hypothetical protein
MAREFLAAGAHPGASNGQFRAALDNRKKWKNSDLSD